MCAQVPCGQPCNGLVCSRPAPCGGYTTGGIAPILNGPIANVIRANVAANLGLVGRH
jgi:hypothetical protein